MEKRNNFVIKKVAIIAVLAALAIVIGLIEIPWPGLIPGLRLDLSDFITIIALGIIGVKGTSIMLFVKAVVRFVLLRLGPPYGPLGGFYEEMVALLASFMYVFAFMIASRFTKDSKPIYRIAIIGVFVTAFVTVGMILANLFFTTPMYLYFMMGADGFRFHVTVFTLLKDPQYIGFLSGALGGEVNFQSFFIFVLTAFGPFNLVKASISAIIGTIVYDRLKTIPMMKNVWPTKISEDDNPDLVKEEEI